MGAEFKACFDKFSQLKEMKNQWQVSHHKLPVYLGATAGMRILNLTDAKAVQQIFQDFKKYIDSSIYKIIDVRMITGPEEALYAWITVNYINHNLIFLDRHDSVGILDMGGASTQIAYEDKISFNKEVTLYGFRYKVYTQSHLCFGAQEFENRYLQYLVDKNYQNNVITDPCANDGHTFSIKGSSFLSSICVKKIIYDQHYEINSNRTFYFTGKYNFKLCSQIVSELIDREKCFITYQYCPKRPASHPVLKRKFFALSNFYFSTLVFNSSKHISGTDFLDQTKDWCSLKWSEISDEYAASSWAGKYCLYLHQIYYILRDLYRFSDEQFRYIEFAEKVENTSLSWAMGFMVTLPLLERPITLDSQTIPAAILLPTIIFCVLIVIGSLLFIKWQQGNKTYYPRSRKLSKISHLAQVQLNTLFQPTKISRSIGQDNCVRNS